MHALGFNRIKFKDILMYYQNCRGLRTKTNIFYCNLCNMNYDVIVLTETWLNSNILSSELFDDRYEVYRRDRETTGFQNNKDGGGVLIAINKNINSARVERWQSNCEDLWVTLDISTSHRSRQVALCAVYLPPPVCLATLDHFVDSCNKVLDSTDIPCYIIGDFNLSKLNWDEIAITNDSLTKTCHNLLDFVNVNQLSQNNHVKNCSGRILDLVLSTEPTCSVNESSSSLVAIDKLHPPLELIVSLQKNCNLPYSRDSRPNFYKANYTEIIDYLNKLNWDELFQNTCNVNDMVAIFYECLRDAIGKFVPDRKPNKRRYPPWFDIGLIKSLKEKNKLRLRYGKYKNPLDKIELKLVSKRCEKLAMDLYNDYIDRIEKDIKDNPKLLWSYIKAKRGGSSGYPLAMSDGQVVTSNGSEICNLFANHFATVYTTDKDTEINCKTSYLQALHSNSQGLSIPVIDRDCLLKKLKTVNISKGPGPDSIPPVFISKCATALVSPLLIIYNTSLASGTFPSEWKKAKVVPVHKSDKKDTVSNYRPISILSTFAKIFESIVCPHLQQHLGLYLNDNQHGFVASRSTATNLVSFTEALIQAVDAGKQFDVLYTDFSKAFDKMSHSILLYKLAAYGITGSLLNWFKSYLTEREFFVVVNGFRSAAHKITSGAPQGSHLAPILFIMFINDLPECFQFSEPFLYADDLKFARVIDSKRDCELLQHDLNQVIKWCHNNKMQLNPKKCYHAKYTRKINCIGTEYFIDQERVQEVETIRDLGVHFDKKVTFVPHIENTIKKSSKMLGFLLRNTKGFRKSSTKIMLYNSLVRSVMEYCSVVWRPHYATHMLRLERVQKRFVWHLAFSEGRSKRLPSYKARLCHFRMQPLTLRRDIIDVLFVYKLLRNKIDCPNLLGLIKFHAPSRYPRNKITPLCPPLRKSVLGANSPIPRLSKILNSRSDLVDVHQDNINKFIRHFVNNPL